MPLLAGVFLRDLQLDRFVRVVQAGKQRRYRFPYLEIDRAVLDLHDHVIVEFSVQRMKDVVSRASAVGLQIVPVEMMVVDEGPIEQHPAVRFQSARQHVRRVHRSAAILRRSGASFRICLHDKSTQVGNLRIHLIDRLLPPGDHPRIERVEMYQGRRPLSDC